MEEVSDEAIAAVINRVAADEFIYWTGGTYQYQKGSLRHECLRRVSDTRKPVAVREWLRQIAHIDGSYGYNPETAYQGLVKHQGAKPCVYLLLKREADGNFRAVTEIQQTDPRVFPLRPRFRAGDVVPLSQLEQTASPATCPHESAKATPLVDHEVIQSTPEKTRERIAQLEAYMKGNVLDGSRFRCKTFGECHASRPDYFYEGQLSHVGRNYDLEVNGCATRIVIVGQEYGSGERCWDLKSRSAMVVGAAEAGFSGRNPHMRGTTSLLRLLLGREVGIDSEGERVIDGHLFDAFALVNYLLCSALNEPREAFVNGAAKGVSSSVMRRNCGIHFRRTLEILEPTAIVLQGQGVRRWAADALRLSREKTSVVENAFIAEKNVKILTFDHPSARGNPWGRSIQSRYLLETVAPTVRSILS